MLVKLGDAEAGSVIVALMLSMALAIDGPVPVVVAPPPIIVRPVISPPSVPRPIITPIYPAPNVSVASKARTNVSALFSMDDYPISAIQNGEEGLVQAQLLIGPDGRLSDCVIFVSSGSAALDQATCAILRRRARFTPARDQSGNPTSDTMMVRIRWELPDAAPFKNWIDRAIVRFDARGRPAGCSYEMEERSEAMPDCSEYLDRAQGLVNGHPDLGERSLAIVFEMRFEADPPPRLPSVGTAPGEQLIERQVAEFEIDPAGNPANCQVTLRKGPISEPNLCEEPHYDFYDPLLATSQGNARRGRSSSAVYLKR